MDTRTDKLIQQAGKFIQQGKFSHALEQYLKAHQLNPGETTILNMIGDLYLRLGKEAEALLWYHKLADALEESRTPVQRQRRLQKDTEAFPRGSGCDDCPGKAV